MIDLDAITGDKAHEIKEARYTEYDKQGLSIEEVEAILSEEIRSSTSSWESDDLSCYIIERWTARRFAMLKPELRERVLETWDRDHPI